MCYEAVMWTPSQQASLHKGNQVVGAQSTIADAFDEQRDDGGMEEDLL